MARQTEIEEILMNRPRKVPRNAWPAPPPTSRDVVVTGPMGLSLVIRFWRDDPTERSQAQPPSVGSFFFPTIVPVTEMLARVVCEHCYVANTSLQIHRWFLHVRVWSVAVAGG